MPQPPPDPAYETHCVGGIEICLFGTEHRGAPVVFVVHGHGGYMKTLFAYCHDLAEDGRVVVALEQRNHGRRMVDRLHTEGFGPSTPVRRYAVYTGTARDVTFLIDFLPAVLGLPCDRVGMVGRSLGAHATLMAMAHDPRIRVGVALIGSGDNLTQLTRRLEAYGIPPAERDAYLTPALRETIERHDPIAHAAAFADRPLLMLQGGEDEVVCGEANERFEAAARSRYTQPERLRRTVFPGVGHNVTPAMWAEGRAWIDRWLPLEGETP